MITPETIIRIEDVFVGALKSCQLGMGYDTGAVLKAVEDARSAYVRDREAHRDHRDYWGTLGVNASVLGHLTKYHGVGVACGALARLLCVYSVPARA